MGLRISVIAIMCLFASLASQAQENRYIVYFTDKAGSGYSLDSPEEFLSSRALQRRSAQQIDIDESDLPVSEIYLTQLNEAGYETYYPSKWLNAVLVQVDPSEIAAIEAFDFVQKVELASSGTRLISGRTSSKFDIQTDNAFINDDQLSWHGIERMHQNYNFGEGRLVAVMDAGFPGVDVSPGFKHMHDNNRILMTENLVEGSTDVYKWHSHGTRVLSIIGGDKEDYRGVAKDSQFMLFITEDVASETRIEEYNWGVAAEKADSAGADIINTSLGYSLFDDSGMDYTYNDMDGETALISRMAANASSKGIVVVVSAGNSGASSWRYITAPADADGILAVGAVTLDSVKAGFSSFGPTFDGRIKPDVASVGVATVHLDPSGNVIAGNGTSFAAPMISGYVALLWNEYPELSAEDLMEMVRNAGHQSGNPSEGLGYGIPFIDIVLSSDPYEVSETNIFPNPTTNLLYLQSKNLNTSFKVIDFQGREVTSGAEFPSNGLDVSGLSNGIYILEIESAQGVERNRFIKQ